MSRGSNASGQGQYVGKGYDAQKSLFQPIPRHSDYRVPDPPSYQYKGQTLIWSGLITKLGKQVKIILYFWLYVWSVLWLHQFCILNLNRHEMEVIAFLLLASLTSS